MECVQCKKMMRINRNSVFIECVQCSGKIHVTCYPDKKITAASYRKAIHNGDLFEYRCEGCSGLPVVSSVVNQPRRGRPAKRTHPPNFEAGVLPSASSPVSEIPLDRPTKRPRRAETPSGLAIGQGAIEPIEQEIVQSELTTMTSNHETIQALSNAMRTWQPASSVVLESNIHASTEDRPQRIDPEYEVIVGGSMRNKDLLVDKLGYQYTVKRSLPNGDRVWRCSRRAKNAHCPAYITQKNGCFTPSKEHTCVCKPGVEIKIQILRGAKAEGLIHQHQSAVAIAEKLLKETLKKHGKCDLPRVDSVARVVNRAKAIAAQPKKPLQPTTHCLTCGTNLKEKS